MPFEPYRRPRSAPPARAAAGVVVAVALLASVWVGAVCGEDGAKPDSPRSFEPIGSNNLLPNAHRVTEKILSGGAPAGEAAFKELADLGVKTIISVDGAKPD